MIKVNNYNIIRTQVLLMFIFIISLAFLILNEKTDKNTSIFAFILYVPYIFILAFYNGILIRFLAIFVEKIILIYVLPILPFFVWFLISDYSLTIRLWKFDTLEVSIGLVLYLSVNIFGYYIFNLQNKK